MRAILGLALAALLCSSLARADSWAPPSTQTYLSEDGQWRLTVVPRAIESVIRYFEDKEAGRSQPGAAPGGPAQPMGQMEHQVQGRWQAVWQAALVNETGPVSAIVSGQGLAVTFNNWHAVGHGSDVVVIYDGAGHNVRALALQDFLPADYVRALPWTASSIFWGDRHGFSADGRQLILRVWVPQKASLWFGNVRPDVVERRLDLATGRLEPLAGPAWERALAAAREVNVEFDAWRARLAEEFRSPLAAPASGDATAWSVYLREAGLRMETAVAPRMLTVGFLPAGAAADDGRDQRDVDKVLHDAVEEVDPSVVVLGSPDPARLVRVLAQVVRALPANGLRRAQVYVTVPPALREAAAQGLAPSGAAFVAIDISVPIPQSPQRLKQLEAN